MCSMFNSIKYKEVDVNNLNELLGDINLIDIREPSEVRTGTLKGAKNIPMRELLSGLDEYLDKDKEYYIMCHSGMRSGRVCRGLSKAGYKVINVSGGISAYEGLKFK